MTEIILLILSIISAAGIITSVIMMLSHRGGGADTEAVRREISHEMQGFAAMITDNQRSIGQMQAERLEDMNRTAADTRASVDRQLTAIRSEINGRLERMRDESDRALEKIRTDNVTSLERLRRDNSEQLSEMRKTVDEKLQETLEARITKSFQLVNDRLEQVYKGLGEMQGLARGVGDLKKVLTNVKARGIMGEIQLGAILEQIMAPEQYAENVATVPGSKNVVEFAVRLPDRQGNTTWLPIDSKFPGDTYAALTDAYESGDKAAADAAAKQLRTRILAEARDIHEKYVSPPHTTDFAIMFLPFEGLYAEVVNRGLMEELQNSYKITVAGPSTMAAMLNSISMGFKTLAIEKRSSEVWQILGAVKTEFGKFESVLTSAQNRINQANAELDKLVGVRTRAINRRLRTVEQPNEGSTGLLVTDGGFEEELL
ncbi:MAG: DNA recombination protein RmuC [Clostridiales bacterium]|nr:DNA recombination protein RmuC [Clostridiales bacterium]